MSFDRIVMNIPADPGPFVEISNPVVVGLGLPEALTGAR
jgi:hypothetical protein